MVHHQITFSRANLLYNLFLEYTHMVNNLQIAFDRATKKYFDQSSSDEEQVLLEYPPIIEPAKVKGSAIVTPPAQKTVQKSEDKKSKHNSNKKKVKSDSSSNGEDEEEEIVEKGKKKSKKKEEKKIPNVKEKSTVGRKRKREKDESENVTKSKKVKKSSDHEDIKDIDNNVSNKKLETKKNKKSNEKNVVLKEVKSNKKSKKKLLLEPNNTSPSKSVKKQSKQSKKNNNSSSSTPVKVSKSEKEKLKNNHSNKYYDSSDVDSDNESIRDLITENYDDDDQVKINDNHNSKGNKKKKQEKDTKSAKSQSKKHKKSKDEQKLSKHSDDALSMSDSERSIIPSITNNDCDSSFERKELSEIKDKFDLIKERRNKNSLPEKTTPVKESIVKKEKLIQKEKHTKDKKKDDKLSIFDQLLAETKSPPSKQQGSNNKSEAEDEKPPKKHSKKDSSKVTAPPEVQKQNASEVKQKGNKKQNKASLDVLDMETEQTLKDINKWLEHTPRFEYNSASNSPSRYVIEDIDMHSKIDDNDFRKPIPLMPSSPSTSNKVFQPSLQKDDKILKDTNNKSLQSSSVAPNATQNLALNKKGLKEPKRKKSRDKLQPLPKKKEIQRTIDRLQPGKTKGNLLTNIQNINKPEELFPLGNREKIKEIKSSLTVETDESSPKLSLGKVLDASAFNMCDPKLEKECFSDNEPSERKSLSDSSIKGEDFFEKSEMSSPNEKTTVKPEVKAEVVAGVNDTSSGNKPNLNAWFKAFGVPKKPKNVEDLPSKKFAGHESKIESSYTSSRQRKLSTGSSISERSSVEDSPQVGLDERAGAPAPFPSPIGASPMSVTASPKPDEIISQKSNYPINSSTRVGFYQDTTSTKSSPDKSCSPREMLSPYHGQYSQQSNVYTAANATNSNAYSNFYNPESTNKQRQTNYSKPTNSPTPYYDQYKQPMSQDSDFNNSMSPNTNPNSPYHSQQSSPYQQQPNSPYQSNSSSGNNISNSGNIIDTRSPVSPYSQPNSPYQQTNQAASPFNSQASQVAPQGPSTPQTNQQAPPNFNNQHYNAMFNQPAQQQPEITQFSPNPQQQQQQEPKIPPTPNYNLNMQQQQQPSTGGIYGNSLPSQHPTTTAHAPTKINSNIIVASQAQPVPVQQQMIYPENAYVDPNKNRVYASKKPEPQPVPTVIPSEPTPRFAAEQKIDENPKYLDLSKQANRQHPHYQQPTIPTNAYSKPEYDKSQSYEMLARSMQKSAAYGPMDSCAVPNELSYDARQKIASYGTTIPNVSANHNDSIKDLTKSSSISNLMQNSAATNLMHQAHQSIKTTQPSPMDINYKQSPLFNTSSASSMMELTAFMRDFRQAEDRFSSFPNPSSGFYDKPITPSHMFGKNIVSSASTLQQMFSNPMTTMAYGREQQEYQNRLNAFQAAANSSQSVAQASQLPVETKAKKPKKSKKNPSPEIPPPASTQHPAMAQHQMTSNQQQSHQQFAMHQQSFQSFAGLKIPSAGSATSAETMKSVVPGSAFNYGPTPLGLYGENSPYLDEFRGAQGSYYPPLRSSEGADKSTPNPPQAHPAAPSSPYHHLLPSHHPPRSYPFMNSIDPATLQQQYRMMFNQTYQAGYLGMHNQPPWHM